MISLRESVVIKGPLEEVWRMLGNAEVVAACIPGAELAGDSSEDVWRGRIKVKFGPTVAAFRGEATMVFDNDAKRCQINGRGIDQRGASRANATLEISAASAGVQETTLAIDGQFNVTGPLGAFASTGGVHVARLLLTEFATHLAARIPAASAAAVVGSDMSAAATPAPTAAKAAELSAISLFGRLLAGWFRSLFRKRNA